MLDILELELHMIMSYSVGAGNWTQALRKSAPTTEPSLQTQVLQFYVGYFHIYIYLDRYKIILYLKNIK